MRISRELAKSSGYTIDDSCYPPVAYKGARFHNGSKLTFTPLEHELMGLAYISMQSLWLVYLHAQNLPDARAAKEAYEKYVTIIKDLTGEDLSKDPS